MEKRNSRVPWILLGLFMLFTSGTVVAQVFLAPIAVQDIKSNGTAIGWFHQRPAVRYLNFKTGTKYTTGGVLNVGVQSAIQDPDLGVVQSPNGIQIGTTVARPTCVAGYRGDFWTVEVAGTGDAGVKDLTYQCCKAANGTYAWVAVACQ